MHLIIAVLGSLSLTLCLQLETFSKCLRFHFNDRWNTRCQVLTPTLALHWDNKLENSSQFPQFSVTVGEQSIPAAAKRTIQSTEILLCTVIDYCASDKTSNSRTCDVSETLGCLSSSHTDPLWFDTRLYADLTAFKHKLPVKRNDSLEAQTTTRCHSLIMFNE